MKNFKPWNDKKSEIDNFIKRVFFHEREIWYCHLGVNVGFEQDGVGEDYLRPVLILKKFNNEVAWIIPLSKTKKRNQYTFEFSFIEGVQSAAILSQIRLIDTKRLVRKKGDMKEVDFVELNKKLKALLP